MSLITSSASEQEIDEYTAGSCHILAVALHRKLGWSIELRLDNDEPYWVDDADPDNFIASVLHVYALDENMRAWDIRGVRPYDDISAEMEEAHSPGSPDSDECRNEQQLRPYVGCWADDFDGDDAEEIDRPLNVYSNEEVNEAWSLACRVFSNLPGFDPSGAAPSRKSPSP